MEAGPNVADRGHDGTEHAKRVGFESDPYVLGLNDGGARQGEEEVGDDHQDDLADDAVFNDVLAQVNGAHGAGMDAHEEFTEDGLRAHDPAHHFDAPAGAPRRSADEHGDEQDGGGDAEPRVEVGRRVAGGRDHREGLKERVPGGLLDRAGGLLEDERGAQEERHRPDGEDVRPKLFVRLRAANRTGDDAPREGEARAGQKHERNDGPLHEGHEGLDAARLRGKAARGHGREAVGHRVVQRHVGGPAGKVPPVEQHDFQNRQARVQDPEPAGGVGDAGHETAEPGPRGLRFQQLGPAHGEPGQDGHGEYDDAHPAEPLRELPPHHEGGRMEIHRNVLHDGGAGGGEPAHAFEERVHRHRHGAASGEHIRHGPDQGGQQPREGDQQKPLPRPEVRVGLQLFEGPPPDQCSTHGHRKDAQILPVDEGDEERHQKRHREPLYDGAGQAGGTSPIRHTVRGVAELETNSPNQSGEVILEPIGDGLGVLRPGNHDDAIPLPKACLAAGNEDPPLPHGGPDDAGPGSRGRLLQFGGR